MRHHKLKKIKVFGDFLSPNDKAKHFNEELTFLNSHRLIWCAMNLNAITTEPQIGQFLESRKFSPKISRKIMCI
jgi:hypothetical protein